MRMIEDPVLTLCHFPSPGTNPEVPERKKSRVLPCVSLSLLCFSPPTATSPPSSPTLSSRRDIFCPPKLPTSVSSSLTTLSSSTSFEKAGGIQNPQQKGSPHHSTDQFDKIDDSLNTPVTAAEGASFFGSTVPLLDPPPIGSLDSDLTLSSQNSSPGSSPPSSPKMFPSHPSHHQSMEEAQQQQQQQQQPPQHPHHQHQPQHQQHPQQRLRVTMPTVTQQSSLNTVTSVGWFTDSWD